MSILDQLATAQGRRDEAPNQEMAECLAEREDRAGIAELAAHLFDRNPNLQSDCIKTLYEVGSIKPELIAPYALDFVRLLRSRNNRLVWGAMLALATIGRIEADTLFPHVSAIQKAMQNGSVITVDGGVQALAGIASANPEYNAAIFPYLLEHLRTCRPKEVPQHAEKTVQAVNSNNKDTYISLLENRLPNATPAQATRLRKVIKQAQQK